MRRQKLIFLTKPTTTLRPPVGLLRPRSEVGPLSNAAREKRADPSLTWLRKGQQTRKISGSFGFYVLRTPSVHCAEARPPLV